MRTGDGIKEPVELKRYGNVLRLLGPVNTSRSAVGKFCGSRQITSEVWGRRICPSKTTQFVGSCGCFQNGRNCPQTFYW